LNTELNCTEFIRCADSGSEKMVPFQDTSSDTFFHVGR
uniref:Transferrin n=1 Tax=Heligmosomoides polygyrus TaxID=6339 RepID=A0A183FJY2_HELPZ